MFKKLLLGMLLIFANNLSANNKIQIDTSIEFKELISAIKMNSSHMVDRITEKGVNVNGVMNNYGVTPLMLSSYSNDEKAGLNINRNLIARGADVNQRAVNGKTALHYASIKNNLKIAKELIEKGAKINFKIKNGDTLLYIMHKKGNNKAVEFLLKNGADINIKNGDGFSYADKVNNFKKKYLNKYFKLKENTPACSNKNYINGATNAYLSWQQHPNTSYNDYLIMLRDNYPGCFPADKEFSKLNFIGIDAYKEGKRVILVMGKTDKKLYVVSSNAVEKK